MTLTVLIGFYFFLWGIPRLAAAGDSPRISRRVPSCCSALIQLLGTLQPGQSLIGVPILGDGRRQLRVSQLVSYAPANCHKYSRKGL